MVHLYGYYFITDDKLHLMFIISMQSLYSYIRYSLTRLKKIWNCRLRLGVFPRVALDWWILKELFYILSEIFWNIGNILNSDVRCNRRKTSSSDRHSIPAWWIIWSWLRFSFNNFCIAISYDYCRLHFIRTILFCW